MYNDSSIFHGVTYYYIVRAINSKGESTNSNQSFATSFNVPTAPNNLNATLGKDFVLIIWQSPISNGGNAIIGYNVYRSMIDGSGYLFLNSTTQLFYNDSSIVPGITYYYIIRAYNNLGESNASIQIIITLQHLISSSLTSSTSTSQISSSSSTSPISPQYNSSLNSVNSTREKSFSTPIDVISIIFGFGVLLIYRKRIDNNK